MKKLRSGVVLFALSMLAYAILLVVSILALRRFPDTPWGFPIALVPVVPGMFAAMAIAREISSRDELQRRIQLEAIAFAFPATAIVALSIGLLENVGVQQLNGTFYVPIMVGLWGLGQVLSSRRYR